MGGKKNNAEKLVGRLVALLHSFALVEEKEKAIFQLLLEASGDAELAALDVPLTECHIAGKIKEDARLNTTGLAKSMGMTKGGVSKLAARMVEKKLLSIKRLPENQKEIYYELTTLGGRLADLHARLRQQEERRLGKMVSEYGNKQIEANIKMLDDLEDFLCKRKKQR